MLFVPRRAVAFPAPRPADRVPPDLLLTRVVLFFACPPVFRATFRAMRPPSSNARLRTG